MVVMFLFPVNLIIPKSNTKYATANVSDFFLHYNQLKITNFPMIKLCQILIVIYLHKFRFLLWSCYYSVSARNNICLEIGYLQNSPL